MRVLADRHRSPRVGREGVSKLPRGRSGTEDTKAKVRWGSGNWLGRKSAGEESVQTEKAARETQSWACAKDLADGQKEAMGTIKAIKVGRGLTLGVLFELDLAPRTMKRSWSC